MDLIKNVEENKFGIEGEVFFRKFNKYIALSIEDDNLSFAKECAEYLDSLSENVFEVLCEASIRYCNSFLDAIGEPTKSFHKTSDILNLIYPSVLIVPYPENGNMKVIHMELNCDWEPEHGMEWVVREDKVLYVGAFNGEDPWSDFSQKDPGNYA